MNALFSPSEKYRPKLFADGDKWCALYGEDLQEGVAGFGDSPHQAMLDFDKAWFAEIDRKNPIEEIAEPAVFRKETIYVPKEAGEKEAKFIERVIKKLSHYPMFKPYMAQAVGEAIFEALNELVEEIPKTADTVHTNNELVFADRLAQRLLVLGGKSFRKGYGEIKRLILEEIATAGARLAIGG